MNRTWRRQENRRWWKPVTIGAAALAVTAGGLGVAMASENGNTTKAAGSIVCPDVAGELPAIPARAKAEVDRNLTLLQTQINEANARLARDGDQGGPNFVNNAILGPLKGKRVSTIDRIAISIGRAGEKPQGLDRLAACSLSGEAAAPPAEQAPPAEEAPPAAEAPPAEEGGNGDADAPFGVISCPDVAGKLPAVPASAQAEIDRNLALLQTQIDEANARLSRDGDQGGPNFVRNAILGPLEDKRVATINRMATAIGRTAAKPVGLDALAPCALND
jgi:hypothetical protein